MYRESQETWVYMNRKSQETWEYEQGVPRNMEI